jgi:hypothetical protein
MHWLCKDNKLSGAAHKKTPRMTPFSEHRPMLTDAHAGRVSSIFVWVVKEGREA